ncbi:MAG: hypothetical protein ACO349_05005 [Flavobacteriaceae bacterium]
MNRKAFITRSSSLIAGGFLISPNSLFSTGKNILGSNDRIRVGTIGLNGMGWSNTKAILKTPGVELAAFVM